MKQLAFQLGRQQVYLDLDVEDVEDQDDLIEIMANAHLNANFLALGREVRWSIHHDDQLDCLYSLSVGYNGTKETRRHL